MAAKVKAAVKNKDINSLFNEITGEGVVPPNIAFKKYNEFKEKIQSFLTLLENFSKGSFAKTYKEYERPMAEILAFCIRSRAEIAKMMPEPPFTEIQLIIPGQIKIELMEEFSNTYKSAKNMHVINTCIKTCSNLVSYKNEIKEKKNGYIKSMPGANFAPFPFTSFNVKEAFIRPDITENFKLNIMTFIALVFEYTHDVYKLYTSPDWDPDVFVHVMRENLVLIRKQIPRCDKAFDKIDKSLDLLKDKMNDYYADFVATKNPSIMMENFVNDVAQDNTNTDIKTTMQFKTIIKRYKEMTNNNIKDPRMKTLFEKVDNMNVATFGQTTEDQEEKTELPAGVSVSLDNGQKELDELERELEKN